MYGRPAGRPYRISRTSASPMRDAVQSTDPAERGFRALALYRVSTSAQATAAHQQIWRASPNLAARARRRGKERENLITWIWCVGVAMQADSRVSVIQITIATPEPPKRCRRFDSHHSLAVCHPRPKSQSWIAYPSVAAAI